MNTPFISFIVPVYNVEDYLHECVDSIIGQTCCDWELILIDDGSPDRCPQICDEYAAKDNRIKVIHQKNAGVAAARNAGLDAAQGEWIWFVDSDDIVEISHVPESIKWLKEHDYTDLVMFDLDVFNDGDILPSVTDAVAPMVVEDGLGKNDFFLRYVCYHHQRLWYRRRLVSYYQCQLRFTPGLKVCEDGEFQYKYLILCQRPVKINRLVYHYRQRNGSATKNPETSRQVVSDTLTVLSNLKDFMIENNVSLEPWLSHRLKGTFKVLMVAAFRYKNIDRNNFQSRLRDVIDEYDNAGYPLKRIFPIMIGYHSISLYFLLIRFYFYIKSIK